MIIIIFICQTHKHKFYNKHTHGNVKENRNMCEGRGHRRTYVIKSSAPTSSTVKNKIYIYIN